MHLQHVRIRTENVIVIFIMKARCRACSSFTSTTTTTTSTGMPRPTLLQHLLNKPSQKYSSRPDAYSTRPSLEAREFHSVKDEMIRIAGDGAPVVDKV